MTFTTRGLVTSDQHGDQPEARLVGASCEACHTHVFPFQERCPKCASAMHETVLPPHGTVWSWTVQRIEPKLPYLGPEDYEMFAVGYVDLGPLKIESRLEGRSPDAWQIGDPVRLVTGTPDLDGNVWRYRFVDARAAGATA